MSRRRRPGNERGYDMLDREDYTDSCCCTPGHPCASPHHDCRHDDDHRARIPVEEIIAECDRLFQEENFADLGDHLRKWRAEARRIGDREGELSMLSELMGHYRMTGDEERGMAAVRDGFALMEELDMGGTVSAGTIRINGATALQAFGEFEEALRHYDEAFRCYGANLDPADRRFAGLFNNMAAALAATGEFRHADAYYRKALEILEACGDRMDAAVTYVNLAQLYDQCDRHDPRIAEALDIAMACFDDPAAVRDGYYAHTCRKCASAFGLFGRGADERDLNGRADRFHEGH